MGSPHWRVCLRRQTARLAAIGLIAGHNLVQNTVLNEKGYTAGNAVVAAALIGLAERSGSSLVEMGLKPRLGADGRRVVAATAATAVVLTVAAVVHPRTRALLRDERARDASWQVVWRKALIRFPLGTALFEEVAFRGALPPLLSESERAGDLSSSTLFGLWHVIPTARALRGNPLGGRVTNPARTVATGAVAAGLTGLVLTSARRRTGSVFVPWLLHSIFNIASYLGGIVAWHFK